jgi:hypothetical protein
VVQVNSLNIVCKYNPPMGGSGVSRENISIGRLSWRVLASGLKVRTQMRPQIKFLHFRLGVDLQRARQNATLETTFYDFRPQQTPKKNSYDLKFFGKYFLSTY